MKIRPVLYLICFVGWCLWSCSRIQSYSEIPEIRFKKMFFADSIDNPDLGNLVKYAFLSFSFVDGDGNLGVRPQDVDSISRIYYTWHKKLPDHTYEPYQLTGTNAITQWHIIPYNSVMDRSEAQNKTLKGTIEIKLKMPKNPQEMDTMRVEFYITDRARNKSNIEYTPDFSILNPPDTELTK